jgi:hypothetical protein
MPAVLLLLLPVLLLPPLLLLMLLLLVMLLLLLFCGCGKPPNGPSYEFKASKGQCCCRGGSQ